MANITQMLPFRAKPMLDSFGYARKLEKKIAQYFLERKDYLKNLRDIKPTTFQIKICKFPAFPEFFGLKVCYQFIKGNLVWSLY